MNETRLIKTKQEKVVSRNVAVALGIICIVVVASLVGAFAYYTPIINGKDTTISSLNSSLNAENAEISQLYFTINSLKANLTMNNLTDILSLNESTVWVDQQTVSQPTNSYTNWTFLASYAGYLMVEIDVTPIFVNGIMVLDTGIIEGIYVRVIYNFGTFGGQPPLVLYNNEANLGGIGMTAHFEVLPTNIEIDVGNTKMIGSATETVTITYYY
jgi:hypothetical protein